MAKLQKVRKKVAKKVANKLKAKTQKVREAREAQRAKAPTAPKRNARDVRIVTHCRACAGSITEVFTLGSQHLNCFPPKREGTIGPATPLDLMSCDNCSLIQLRHTVPPDWLYREYWYRSGVNEMMRTALRDVVVKACARVGRLGNEHIVMDIGANDGTLLEVYQGLGISPIRAAWEPARNLHSQLAQHCEVLHGDFFPPETIPSTRAMIITSIAMFYDLEDPGAFVRAVYQCLHPEGIWVVEFAYLPRMIMQNAFDTICHEHVEYFSFRSFLELINTNGLRLIDVEENDVNGGSLRAYVARDRSHHQRNAQAIARIASREAQFKLGSKATWSSFHTRIDEIKARVRTEIQLVTQAGGTVDVYGASTKGNVLLQYFGLDHSMIRQAIDRSPTKVGRYTVGTGIPIVDETTGRANPANMWLVLPWHFREGILKREEDYLKQGGRILFPLPKVDIVESL